MSVTSADDDLVELIQAQLEGLRKTPDGLFLYRMIDRGLQNRGGDYTGDTSRDFVGFLHALLQKYAANSDGDTVTRIKVRLLQQRLAPHLKDKEEKASPAPMNVSRPAKPEEVLIEALPEEPPLPAYEVTKTVAPLPAASDGDTNSVAATAAESGSGSGSMPPESLVIEGLELDESTFEKELAQRTANEIIDEPRPQFNEQNDLANEDAANTGEPSGSKGLSADDQASRDAKAEAIRASLRPLTDTVENPRAPSKSATFDSDRNEYDVNIKDTLSIDEPINVSDADSKKKQVKKAPAAKRFSISDHISSDVKAELSRNSRRATRKKSSKPLAIDPDFNRSSHDRADEPDIVVGSVKTSTKSLPSRKQNATNLVEPKSTKFVKNASRDRVDRLHETFASKLADGITRSRGYHKLLKSNLRALKLADSPDDVLDIKHLLVMGLEDLLRGNEMIRQNLGATNHYLKISQLDRSLLKDELGRVRDQSLVDELTGLQNKVAFGKQIEAEVGRSKRYGFSLALAVVVLDQFDVYAKQFGRDAGDEVIRTFANQVLTGFRGYDAVARLSEYKFGILFPNTQKEGALSALEKAQKHAAETVIQLNGKSLRLPTFTSSLTLFSPGDKPEALMKRAYDALAVINKNTRNKIIVALAQT